MDERELYMMAQDIADAYCDHCESVPCEECKYSIVVDCKIAFAIDYLSES